MNLDRLILEVRPTGGTHALADLRSDTLPSPDPVLVWGRGEGAAATFLALGPQLAYGSAVLLFDCGDLPDILQHDFRYWNPPGIPEGGRVWVKSHYDGSTYATHVSHLLRAVELTSGPVLELGSGDGSTPALHEACAATARPLVTVDNDVTWLRKYRDRFGEKGHLWIHLDDPARTSWLDQNWGVVFVDHAPGHTRRRAIERARGHADYIVVHDTEELGYGLEDLLSSFKYRRDFRYARPWTTVVSDSREVW